MTMAVMRVPAPSLSGIRALRFAGFLEADGQTLQFNPLDMGYMGGADLDIDSAYVMQEMPDDYMLALEKYRYEWHENEDSSKGFREVKEDKRFIKDEAVENTTISSVYDTNELLKTGINAYRGKTLLSAGISYGNRFVPWYTNVVSKLETFGDATPERKPGREATWINEAEGIYWTAKVRKDAMSRKDGLPYLVRELVNYAADSADYGRLIDVQAFRRLIMERFFEDVTVWRGKRNITSETDM